MGASTRGEDFLAWRRFRAVSRGQIGAHQLGIAEVGTIQSSDDESLFGRRLSAFIDSIDPSGHRS